MPKVSQKYSPKAYCEDARENLSSPFVRRYAEVLVRASSGLPILDVACGSGRNALPLAELGCEVICIDKDLDSLVALRSSLEHSGRRHLAKRLVPHELDLVLDVWPFGPSSVGGVLSVHCCLGKMLFPLFEGSLVSGGYLLFQTVPGCGQNYLELPKRNGFRQCLASGFNMLQYRERAVGPAQFGAVTVQALAMRIRDRSTDGGGTRTHTES